MKITIILFFISILPLSAAKSNPRTTYLTSDLQNAALADKGRATKAESFAYPVENNPVVPNQAKHTVKGQVLDETGDSVIGASVSEKGNLTNGTMTDADGNFSLTVQPNATVIVSFIGYLTQEIPVQNKTSLSITLIEDVKSLEEVVVVGYGKLSKRKISGAVSNVKKDDFNPGVSLSASDLLRGRVAGLSITSSSGDVTSGQTIRLRGTSSLTGSSEPFVVIDGIPGMSLDAVSPEDIESISVLKDASSSAIYGSRSASGVILITTKKGSAGTTSVEYQAYMTTDHIAKKPDLLSAGEWRAYAKSNNLDITGLDFGADTDWIDEITRVGFSHNHNLSISGNLKNGAYRISLNYINRQGIMRDNFNERYNGLLNFNQRFINNKVNISIMAGLTQADYSKSNATNVQYAYNMIPTYPVKKEDGSWFDVFVHEMGNPVHNIEENENEDKSNNTFFNLRTDVEIISGLQGSLSLFKQRGSIDEALYHSKTSPAGNPYNGYARRYSSTADKKLLEATLTYSKELGSNNFEILGGYSYEDNDIRSHNVSNRNFLSDIFSYNSIQAGEGLIPEDIASYKSNSKLISFFGRVNYSFKDRYILSATVRRDGSSKFGNNNKWANFPSVSAAWRISDEEFMKKVSLLDDLKFRVGYGVVGNQSGIDPYQSVALYGSRGQYYDNGKWHTAYKYSQNHNPDLKWEQTSSFNPGIDFMFLNGRLGGAIDYYIKDTKDLLFTYAVAVPPNNFPTKLANVGNMRNKGLEIELTGVPIDTKDFRWNVSVNFAHNKNKVVRLSNDEYSTGKIHVGWVASRGMGEITSSILEEGQEIGTFYNLKHMGFDKDGKLIIWDKDNNGEINSDDYTYIGHAQPDFTYGINNSFQYKNIDFSFFLRGVQGNDVLNSPRIQYANPQWLPGMNVFREALTSKLHPSDAVRFSDYYIEDGSFLRLENVTLGYNFKFKPLSPIKKLRAYVTAQNLFVLTKFNGMDPEVNMDGLSPGVLDNHYIPRARTFFAAVFNANGIGGDSNAIFLYLHYLTAKTFGIDAGTWNGPFANPNYVKSFDLDDIRYEGSFLIGEQIDPETGKVFITQHGRPLIHTVDVVMNEIGADGLGWVDQEEGARINKWEYQAGTTLSMKNDIHIFRLADVYLMKAEAILRSGGSVAEATQLVNRIRQRGFPNHPEKLYSTVTLDDVYRERRFEFAFENMTRQDMIRFGTFLAARPPFKPKVSDPTKLLFPIPQEVINANPNIKQNPGY